MDRTTFQSQFEFLSTALCNAQETIAQGQKSILWVNGQLGELGKYANRFAGPSVPNIATAKARMAGGNIKRKPGRPPKATAVVHA